MPERLSAKTKKESFLRLFLHYGLGLFCTVLLALLVGLTVVDVIARYWFNAPVQGAFELTQLILAALIFSALPLTTYAGEHVEVDIFYQIASHGPKKFMRILGAVVSAISLWCISWRLAHHAAKLATDGAMTDALSLPLSPIAWLGAGMTALSGVLSILFLAQFSLADEMLGHGSNDDD